VLRHFPAFRNEYASLGVELTSSSLPGSDRAQSLSKQLSQILDRDASDAPVTLGAEESTLVDNLSWAREVKKSLGNHLGVDAKEAASLISAIASLPKVGVLENLTSSTATLRDELQECLSREDFFHVASDILNRLTSLRQHVNAAASELVKEIETHVATQRDSITAMEEWTGLPEEDRSEFSSRLDGLDLPEAQDIAGIRQLLNRRMEIDAALSQVRSAVMDRHKKRQEEQTRPLTPELETPDEKSKPKPAIKVRLRRRYTFTDQPALQKVVSELTTGLESLKSETSSEINIDLE
jgi:hypothetical protein